jgi:hypothetical protein
VEGRAYTPQPAPSQPPPRPWFRARVAPVDA